MLRSVACLAWIVVLTPLQAIGAEATVICDETAVSKELTEIKQVLEKLSAQVRSLERKLDPRVAKTYRVTDLVTPASGVTKSETGVSGSPFANFRPLVRYITTHIAPQQWEGAGGQGTIRVYEQNLSIVVSQSEEVHAEIAQSLERIREAKAVLADFDAPMATAEF